LVDDAEGGGAPEILAKNCLSKSYCTGLRQKPGIHTEWLENNGIASKIGSPTTYLTMADMLSLFQNTLYKTHVYFVMSLVSAFTDPNVHTPHIPSSRSRVVPNAV
jgi:hypothetical protein